MRTIRGILKGSKKEISEPGFKPDSEVNMKTPEESELAPERFAGAKRKVDDFYTTSDVMELGYEYAKAQLGKGNPNKNRSDFYKSEVLNYGMEALKSIGRAQLEAEGVSNKKIAEMSDSEVIHAGSDFCMQREATEVNRILASADIAGEVKASVPKKETPKETPELNLPSAEQYLNDLDEQIAANNKPAEEEKKRKPSFVDRIIGSFRSLSFSSPKPRSSTVVSDERIEVADSPKLDASSHDSANVAATTANVVELPKE
ncbi:MAG: hypothetical protein ACHP6I_02675 [Rickettsiales bacterium]